MSGNLHWSEQKEAAKTNFPLLFTFFLIKIFPRPVLHGLVFVISFFYSLFSRRAREEVLRFQTTLHEYTGGKSPAKISIYRTVLSFSMNIVERMEGWVGKASKKDLSFTDDDINDYWENLRNRKGVLLLGSHLGNIDFLRSLVSTNEVGVDKIIPVTVIMKMAQGEHFAQTLKKINPAYEMNVIDPSDIGPDSILFLQEAVERGEIVVITGDRTSENSRERFMIQKFLGKDAEFPYGVFLIASLLKVPVYYVYGIRKNCGSILTRYNVFFKKASVDFSSDSRKERQNNIKLLCAEYAQTLENFAVKFPYQWYNFYDFWAKTGEKL